MKRKIDQTLLELWLGIFAYGAVFEIVLLFFSRNQIGRASCRDRVCQYV